MLGFSSEAAHRGLLTIIGTPQKVSAVLVRVRAT